MDKKDFSSAEKILSDYLQKHPKAPTAMLLLGTARLDAKDFDGAIDEFKAIYQEEFGETLSDDEVQEIGLRLLRFFGTLANADKTPD